MDKLPKTWPFPTADVLRAAREAQRDGTPTRRRPKGPATNRTPRAARTPDLPDDPALL